MIPLLIWLAALVVVLATEMRPKRVAFTIAAFAFLTAVFLAAFGDLGRAALIAVILALMLTGASAVKHHHSGMKLAAGDLALTFAGTIPFMLRQYRRTATLTLTGGALLVAGAIAVILSVHLLKVSPSVRLIAPLATGALAWLLYLQGGGSASVRPDVFVMARFFSFFMGSLADVASWWPTKGLRMLDVGGVAMPLSPKIVARGTVMPDIIVIQHESVFDPRLYGLPVAPETAEFLSPAGGLCGTLHVDIYGGGSWQTEFSVLTGLSSASFGPDSYFLFKKGVGRFHHSLPSELSVLGYKTMLSTSCRRSFLNYDSFYGGLGVEQRFFSDEFPPPFDLAAFEISNSDAMFFAATQAAFGGSLDQDPAPRFMMMLTNFNHGPHEVRAVPVGAYEEARSEALAALNEPTYGEYSARLAETVESYNTFKTALAARFPDRPMLIVRYGDHQPTMSRAVERASGVSTDDPLQFKTFYAIEGVNFEPLVADVPAVLDVAFLGSLALKAAGLPLDEITATRLELMAECGPSYFAAQSDRKRRFHRTLVELGAIQLRPDARPLPIAPPAGEPDHQEI